MKLSIILLTALLFSQHQEAQQKDNFYKKWYLTGYLYWGLSFPPEANERDDFIHFKADGTFESKDEGVLDSGKWIWYPKTRKIYLFDGATNEGFYMNVVRVHQSKMVLQLVDEKESLTIIFKTKG